MNKKKKTISIEVDIPLESFEDFSKGNVSRGAIHMDENGHTEFKRYNLGEGRKIGPRKQFNLPLSVRDADVDALTNKKELTCRMVTDAQGQITGVLIEPKSSLSTLYELMEAILAKFNLKNKGGANANN